MSKTNTHTHATVRGDKKDGSESTRYTSQDLSAVPSTQIWRPGTPPAPRASALPLDSMGTCALVYVATHICCCCCFKENSALCCFGRLRRFYCAPYSPHHPFPATPAVPFPPLVFILGGWLAVRPVLDARVGQPGDRPCLLTAISFLGRQVLTGTWCSNGIT